MAFAVGLLVATVLGLWLRWRDLDLATLSLSIDEARLRLVAEGILGKQWPILPSGKVYTRGLPMALAMAPSLGMLGVSDFAARLPSVVFGTLLVPIVGIHARIVGNSWGGVIAALLTAAYAPLVFWSRQAWFFSLFVLLWSLTLLLLHLGVRNRDGRILLGAACAAAVGVLTHELFATLLPCWALACWVAAGRARTRGELARLVGPALGVLLLGCAVLAAFTLTHRADTLAGRYAELREYLTLNTDLAGFRFYGRLLLDRFWLLLVLAVVGLIWSPREGWTRALIVLSIIPLFFVDAFVLPDRPQERYGLALLPPLYVLASAGLAVAVPVISARTRLARNLIASILGVAILVLHMNVSTTIRRTDVSRGSGTWLADLRDLGYQPDDIVLTDIPTITYAYLGRTDFWIVSHDYEKYAFAPDGQPRDVHTGGLIVRNTAELDRLVRQPNSGKTAWVIASDRSYQWQELVDRSLRRAIEDQSIDRQVSADSTRIYRLSL